MLSFCVGHCNCCCSWLTLLISLSQKSLCHTGWGLHSSDKPGIAPQVEKKKKDGKSQERARLSCCVHKLH